eukprot:TRINITY_DN34139_c0_g1_i1.p1 TRINITY_DN34139_c0_g1~~TRINITY_DN34139_c0_g1_i1.p1  ORF type:complete len:372 (+),score=49.38 TRINITY_DN34139_c0_g1_i1:92-1207(+)
MRNNSRTQRQSNPRQSRRREEQPEQPKEVECGECGGMTDKKKSHCMVCKLPYVAAIPADFDCGELGEAPELSTAEVQIATATPRQNEIYVPSVSQPIREKAPSPVPTPAPIPRILTPTPTPVVVSTSSPSPPPVVPQIAKATPVPIVPTSTSQDYTANDDIYVPSPVVMPPVQSVQTAKITPSKQVELSFPTSTPPAKRPRPDTASAGVKIRPSGLWQVHVTGFPHHILDINEAKQVFPKATCTIADEPNTGFIDFKNPFEMREAMETPVAGLCVTRSWRTSNDTRVYYELIGAPRPDASTLRKELQPVNLDTSNRLLTFSTPVDARMAVAKFSRRSLEHYPRCTIEFSPYDRDIPPTDAECSPYSTSVTV